MKIKLHFHYKKGSVLFVPGAQCSDFPNDPLAPAAGRMPPAERASESRAPPGLVRKFGPGLQGQRFPAFRRRSFLRPTQQFRFFAGLPHLLSPFRKVIRQ